MRTIVNKTIVTWKLGKELIAAGIAHNGMSIFPDAAGDVLEILLVNENQASAALIVINAHDGIDSVAACGNAARMAAKNIPQWATWTQDGWATYFSGNLANGNVTGIGSLADAKLMLAKQNAAINALAKMVIALRDQTWPDLPES